MQAPCRPAVTRSEEIDCVPFQYETRQSASCESPGIDIYSIRSHVRFQYGRMTVDDDFVEIVLAKQEIFTDPQQVFFALFFQGNTRSYSRMGEKVVSTRK